MAEDAAARYREERTRTASRHELHGVTVVELCGMWNAHCLEYYRDGNGRPTSAAENMTLGARAFRSLFGDASVAELTHADMLQLRDALVRSGVCCSTVNRRLWSVKYMIGWALDEALIPATVKAELTQE